MTLLERLLLVPGTEHLRKVPCLSGRCLAWVLRIWRLGTPVVVLHLIRVGKVVLVRYEIAALIRPIIVRVSIPAPANTVCPLVVGSVKLCRV